MKVVRTRLKPAQAPDAKLAFGEYVHASQMPYHTQAGWELDIASKFMK
jgi:hypothetical protein